MACSISSGKPDEGAALGQAYTLEIVQAARADAAFDDKENPLPKNLLGWTPASSPESKFTPLSGRDRGKRLCLSEAEKSYDFFRKNNFFDRTGKISRAKMNG